MYRARPSATRRSLTTATARLQSLAEPPPPLSSRESLRGPQGRSNLLFPRPASWLTLSGGPTILSVEFSLMVWALSSGGESAPLIRVRSVVRVHEGPPRRLRAASRRRFLQAVIARPAGPKQSPECISLGGGGEGPLRSESACLPGVTLALALEISNHEPSVFRRRQSSLIEPSPIRIDSPKFKENTWLSR